MQRIEEEINKAQTEEWNFFASYHGYNPCDLLASILKRKVKNEENNNKKVLTTPEIIDLCNSITFHSSITYESSANTTSSSTIVLSTFPGVFKGS